LTGLISSIKLTPDLPKSGFFYQKMRTSKSRVAPDTKKQIHHWLYQVVTDIKSIEEAEEFLKEILTKAELEAVVKRLAVAQRLTKGESYQEIKQAIKVSSATIATIADKLNSNGGYRLALKKIQADQWAEKWAEKITGMMGKKP
jgi:TrpR-related protein YerC/YecD